jgi:hypothetical protein
MRTKGEQGIILWCKQEERRARATRARARSDEIDARATRKRTLLPTHNTTRHDTTRHDTTHTHTHTLTPCLNLPALGFDLNCELSMEEDDDTLPDEEALAGTCAGRGTRGESGGRRMVRRAPRGRL